MSSNLLHQGTINTSIITGSKAHDSPETKLYMVTPTRNSPRSPLLFNVSYEHVRSLHKLYVDFIVNQFDWHTFVQKLNGEMQDFNLLATVLQTWLILHKHAWRA
ncbi:hypothetical protein F4604DRAFT_1795017 [Suillus subluteus]|nr:hypothetical protein F4604DRAFT_1795017 [Suillus subluteus]